MIAPFLLFAAATVSQTSDYRTLFSRDDYPKQAVRHGEEGTAYVQILVDPAGQVDTCTIIQSTGFADLDQQTCTIIRTRAKFIPAKDKDGHSVFGLDRIPVTWALGSAPTLTLNPGLDLTISQEPPGVRLPLEIKLQYTITPTGTATKCGASGGSLAPQALIDLACQVITTTPFNAIRDHNGTPVSAVDLIKVRFRVKS